MMETTQQGKRTAAIMQPYFFPYMGYYQMAAAVERFLLYDDVNFIKRGYIARNRLLVNGAEWQFSVPLSGASQNKLIKEIHLDMNQWDAWKRKFLTTIELNYHKARNFGPGMALLAEVIDTAETGITTLAERSVRLVMEKLGRPVRFQRTSEMDLRQDLKFEERLIYICKHENITHYIQSQGGVSLYNCATWQMHGLSMQFIRPTSLEYPRNGPWVPGLSMLDAILHVPFGELNPLLDRYELFTN